MHDSIRIPIVPTLQYRSEIVDGVNVFYREAGPKDAPVILLLHGFPTSSHMFRNLIPLLADRYRLIAPDYPGFGYSDAPPVNQFTYSFDHFADLMERFTEAIGLKRFALYVQDYGGPVGFRMATRHPERITGFIVQNANAYEEGVEAGWDDLRDYWKDPSDAKAQQLKTWFTLDTTKVQYLTGVREPLSLNPDAWYLPQSRLDRPGNDDIQLALFYDYRNNVRLYTEWQAYFRDNQPPMLVVWGRNDPIFAVEGASCYKRDLPNAEIHLLDTGHFALEEDCALIAGHIDFFMDRHSDGDVAEAEDNRTNSLERQ